MAAMTTPSSGLHRVVAGDTLSAVAVRYGVPLATLRAWNPAVVGDLILVGGWLRVTRPAVPGKVLDLSRWYLTLPIADPSGRDSSGPWDVFPPALSSFEHPYFRTVYDRGVPEVEYTAPTLGVTTSGESGATRAELREEKAGGGHASWSTTDGREHSLTITLSCDMSTVEGRKECIVGQIHGPGGTPPLYLACDFNDLPGRLVVFRNGPSIGTLLGGLYRASLFTFRIRVKGGKAQVWGGLGEVGDLPVTPKFDLPASGFNERSGLYFKGGAYNKTKIADATTGAAVVRHRRLALV